MKCVILAAGEGKRMHPLTYTRPKVMLPLANTPLLEWNLKNAIQTGLKEFIFVIGYKSEMVRNHFKNGEQWKAHIEYVNQGQALGTAHAIQMAETFVDDFIVLSGDTIFGTSDIKHLMKHPNSIGLVQAEHPENYGVVETKDDKIIKIYEKMQQPLSNLINAGIYHFTHSIFEYIKKTPISPRGEYEITDSMNMLTKETPMKSIILKEWRDVVYPWDLLDANEERLSTLITKHQGTIENNTTLKNMVRIGKDTIIRSGAYIEGPVIIGDNCNIGPNCYIRPYTAIGNNCHVGNACEIKNSIIMANSNIPHQNYVGDSVIGEHCNLGAGTKIANLRLDKSNIKSILNGKKFDTKRRKLGVIMGDNVQTGINSMTNVGSMIGNNVFIGLGRIAAGEIHPNTRLV